MANTTATDDQVPDGMIANNAIAQLKVLTASPSVPWFLAVGLHKPHLPHFAPKAYFDKYELADLIYHPSHAQRPAGGPGQQQRPRRTY